MSLRHVLVSVAGSHGFAYGMLRDFETEIVRLTGASVASAPEWAAPAPVRNRLAHGTRWAPLRRLVPRRRGFAITADVLWLVLMGPESCDFDIFRDWDTEVGYRIVYVFDTFRAQLASLRRLVVAARWDLLITSFADAVPMLERETGRSWIAIPQGVKLDRFAPVPAARRDIGFSSYGRRVEQIHAEIDAWSRETGVYYDRTIAATVDPWATPGQLYEHYAWHLRHSWFTVSWPVELTSPERAGDLSPITCRWFEAAAAATTIVGRAPRDPRFEELFGAGAVLPLDPAPRAAADTRAALDMLWQRREVHRQAAEARRAERAALWTWEARVREILARAGMPAAGS